MIYSLFLLLPKQTFCKVSSYHVSFSLLRIHSIVWTSFHEEVCCHWRLGPLSTKLLVIWRTSSSLEDEGWQDTQYPLCWGQRAFSPLWALSHSPSLPSTACVHFAGQNWPSGCIPSSALCQASQTELSLLLTFSPSLILSSFLLKQLLLKINARVSVCLCTLDDVEDTEMNNTQSLFLNSFQSSGRGT